METLPKISIIVPVYNMERYLHQCVDSILAQTFTEWELLLVDDGSKDSSGQICDEYAEKDARVRVIHKDNTGQADSRNVAIGMAKADLIGFVDSDDWIDPDMYEVLYRTLTENNADISMCGHYLSYKGREKQSCTGGEVKVYSEAQALRMIIDDRQIKSFLVDKLYRREVIRELLPKSFVYEDYATLFKWFVGISRLAICESPKYHYRQRRGSTAMDGHPRKKYHFYLAEKSRCTYLIEHGIFPEYHDRFIAKLVRVGLGQIKAILRHKEDKDAVREYIDLIKSEILTYTNVRMRDLGLFRWVLLQELKYCPKLYFATMKVFLAAFDKKEKQGLYE